MKKKLRMLKLDDKDFYLVQEEQINELVAEVIGEGQSDSEDKKLEETTKQEIGAQLTAAQEAVKRIKGKDAWSARKREEIRRDVDALQMSLLGHKTRIEKESDRMSTLCKCRSLVTRRCRNTSTL